jgi:ubiquinone/menaquinone biosynthesis C-methylase UbiE
VASGVDMPAVDHQLRSGLTATRWRRWSDCARLNGQVARLLLAGRWMRTADVALSYDRLAEAYDETWLVHLEPTTRRLLDALPAVLPPGAIVDLGCGTGFATLHLAERYPGHRVVACDVSSGMLNQARTRLGRHAVTWEEADMSSFLATQPDASAALIVAAWSAGYTDYPRLARQVRRVLRAGGCFASVLNLADTLGPLRRAFRYCMQAHARQLRRLPRFPFPRNATSVRSALIRAGLIPTRFEEGHCPIGVPASDGRRLLPWLLRTGTLAGFDALLPLADTGPVADTFEACLAADPEPLQHHYVLAVAGRA